MKLESAVHLILDYKDFTREQNLDSVDYLHVSCTNLTDQRKNGEGFVR